jgi:hypothetical protein
VKGSGRRPLSFFSLWVILYPTSGVSVSGLDEPPSDGSGVRPRLLLGGDLILSLCCLPLSRSCGDTARGWGVPLLSLYGDPNGAILGVGLCLSGVLGGADAGRSCSVVCAGAGCVKPGGGPDGPGL